MPRCPEVDGTDLDRVMEEVKEGVAVRTNIWVPLAVEPRLSSIIPKLSGMA